MPAFKKGEGGRRPGSKNKLTLAKEKLRAEALKKLNEDLGPNAFSGDGIAFLQHVYKSEEFDFQTRMEAATRAAPFERPKKTESTIDDKREYVVRMPVAPANLDEWKRLHMDQPEAANTDFDERLKTLAAAAAVKKDMQ